MFVRYPPGKIRYEDDRPVALLGVRVAASRFRLVDLPLGMPTTSARSGRGTWALYPLGAEVVVIHPDGAVSGPPAEVAAEVGRLAAREGQGELDRQAARTIQQLLTGDGADRAGPSRRLGARTWAIPATAYWLSGPYNDHGRAPTASPGRSGERPSTDRGMGGPTMHAGSTAGRRRPLGSGPRARARHGSTPARAPQHPRARLTAEASQGGEAR